MASMTFRGVNGLQRVQSGSEAQRPLGPGSQAGFRGTFKKEQQWRDREIQGVAEMQHL